MNQNLVEIAKFQKINKEDNWRLSSFLKLYILTSNEIDTLVRRLYQQVS